MTYNTSQSFESFIPVYDTVPEDWQEAREFLVEHLKKISNAVNIREIGFLLDEELISGKQFIPTKAMSGANSSNSQQFRTVLRKVIDFGALPVAPKSLPHGILFDQRFTLIDIWCAGTKANAPFQARCINPNNVVMDATQVTVNSAVAFDRSFVFIEYIQEI